MKKISLIIIILMFSFLTTSCENLLKGKFQTDHYKKFNYIKGYSFKYKKLGEFPYTIYKIRKENINDPIIVFPYYIEQKIVTDLGVVFDSEIYGTIRYDFDFGKQQKIYFNSYNTINAGLNFYSDNYLKLFAPNFTFSNLEITKNKFLNVNGNEKNIIYLNYNEYQKSLNLNNKYNIQPANVSYYIGDANPFFIDDVDGDYIISEPPTPYKEGYEFDGWYYDVNFEKEIDFNYEKIPNKIYDKNGNYLYIENKLYAKWVNRQTNEVYKYENYK